MPRAIRWCARVPAITRRTREPLQTARPPLFSRRSSAQENNVPLSLARNQRLPSASVAFTVPALENRNLLWNPGRHDWVFHVSQICVDRAALALAISPLG